MTLNRGFAGTRGSWLFSVSVDAIAISSSFKLEAAPSPDAGGKSSPIRRSFSQSPETFVVDDLQVDADYCI
jgi:hypothetical protein